MEQDKVYTVIEWGLFEDNSCELKGIFKTFDGAMKLAKELSNQNGFSIVFENGATAKFKPNPKFNDHTSGPSMSIDIEEMPLL